MSTIQKQQESIPELTLYDLANILRRTKAEQCTGQLTKGKNKFCALGVLAHELFGMPGGIPFGRQKEYSDMIRDELPKLGISAVQIWSKNDGRRWTFNQIADWLESKEL